MNQQPFVKLKVPGNPEVGSVRLQRKCACEATGETCSRCASNKGKGPAPIPKKKSGLQPKLVIGASNDPLEQEADRVADQVMAASTHSTVSGSPPRIQRYAGQTTVGTDTAPASVDRVLANSGRPLEPALRQDMGQRCGGREGEIRVGQDSPYPRSHPRRTNQDRQTRLQLGFPLDTSSQRRNPEGSSMNINLVIDKLVVEGVPLSRRERVALEEFLRESLTQALSERAATHALPEGRSTRLERLQVNLPGNTGGVGLGKSLGATLGNHMWDGSGIAIGWPRRKVMNRICSPFRNFPFVRWEIIEL